MSKGGARKLGSESAVAREIREIREIPRRREAEAMHRLIQTLDRALAEKGAVTQGVGEAALPPPEPADCPESG